MAADVSLLEKLRKEYELISESADLSRLALVERLSNALAEQRIVLPLPVESRLKTWSSVEEKLNRTKLDIRSVLDLQDLVGVRFIVLLRPEIEQVCTTISKQFQSTRQSNPVDRLGDDEFGYSSTHIVADLDKGSTPPQVEIQIRTAAEHLWAIASHRLQYKQADVPRALSRAMGRTAAALEMVDAELERAGRQVQQFTPKHVDEPDAEFDLRDDDGLGVIPVMMLVEDAWPDRGQDEECDYSALMIELLNVDIITNGQLRKFLAETREEVIKEERGLIGAMIKEKKLVPAKAAFLRRSSQLFTQVGAVRTALMLRFADRYRAYGWSGEDVGREFFGDQKAE